MTREKDTCQSCAKNLPELETMNYCPYCGVKLYQENVGDMGQELLDDFTKDKKSLEEMQRATREKYEEMFVNTQVKNVPPENIYSLILKACDNKQVLIDCLNQILTRGETAIRLAVTTMPAILLYKVSKETINTVASVLKDVDAVYSVVEGDFDYSGFLKSEQFIALNSTSKAFLKSMPKTMWLGENVKFISEAMFFEERKGCCVLGDNAFYFLPYEKESAFVLLPAYRLETIDTWELDGRYFAEWISNDGQAFKMEFEAEKDIKTLETLIYDGLI